MLSELLLEFKQWFELFQKFGSFFNPRDLVQTILIQNNILNSKKVLKSQEKFKSFRQSEIRKLEPRDLKFKTKFEPRRFQNSKQGL
jgi:hypothetical protein